MKQKLTELAPFSLFHHHHNHLFIFRRQFQGICSGFLSFSIFLHSSSPGSPYLFICDSLSLSLLLTTHQRLVSIHLLSFVFLHIFLNFLNDFGVFFPHNMGVVDIDFIILCVICSLCEVGSSKVQNFVISLKNYIIHHG